MDVPLPSETVLAIGMMESILLQPGTIVVPLRPGAEHQEMASPVEYTFSPRMKVRVKATGQIGYLDRDVVINYWYSPLVPGSPAAAFCEWQLQLIPSVQFLNDFKQALHDAIMSGRHRVYELYRYIYAFLRHSRRLHGVANYGEFTQFAPFSAVLFRFYTGHQHGLLPRILTASYPTRGTLDPMRLMNEQTPVSLTPRTPTPVFEHDMRDSGMRVDSSSHGASAHGQGFTANSPYVSTGPSLPNLMSSTSMKLKVIIFGKTIVSPEMRAFLADLDQATHLGVFLVPSGKWRCEMTGWESRQEREIIYCGFDGAGYEGLWEHELFTLPNPYLVTSPYAVARNPKVIDRFQSQS